MGFEFTVDLQAEINATSVLSKIRFMFIKKMCFQEAPSKEPVKIMIMGLGWVVFLESMEKP